MKKVFVIFLLTFQYLSAQTDRFSELADSLLNPDSLVVPDTIKVADSVKTFKLNIYSNLDNAKIYSDSTFIGLTPLKDHEIKEGNYNFRILNPKSMKEWQNDNSSFSCLIRNDTTINVNFQYFYFINTDPYDATVLKNDTILGDTPLRFFKDHELSGNLLIKKKNFKDYLFDLRNYDFEKGANITLQSKGKEQINDLVYKDRATQFKTRRTILPILGTAGASITSCVLAFNFKNNANKYYDRYLFTNNSTDLDTSNQNDTYFLISVLIMQAAVGGLIYFLFFD